MLWHDCLCVLQFIVEPPPPPPEGIPPGPPVLLDTIINTIRKAHYVHIRELCVWDLELEHKNVANVVCTFAHSVDTNHIYICSPLHSK